MLGQQSFSIMKPTEPVYKEPTMPDDDVNEKEQKTTSQTQTYVGEEKMQLENPELVDGTDKNKKRKMQLETSELADDDFNNKKKQKMQLETPKSVDVIYEIMESVTDEEPEPTYIGAAFRSQCANEVFMFIGYEYLVIKYDPCTRGSDEIVKGPFLIIKGFPTLHSFQGFGVSAAFSCHGTNHAFLFQGPFCAKVEYDIETKKGQVLNHATTSFMFPALEETIFAECVDAAFESTIHGKVYLFSKKEYCLFDYINGTIIFKGTIEVGFPCLKGTVFESGIGAAFASHNPNEAYLFKDNSYLRMKFSPDESNSPYIIEGPMDVLPSNWPSLKDIMPYYMDFDPCDLYSFEGEVSAASESEDTAASKGEDIAASKGEDPTASKGEDPIASKGEDTASSEDDVEVNDLAAIAYYKHVLESNHRCQMSGSFEEPDDLVAQVGLIFLDYDSDSDEKEQKWTPHTQTYVGEEKMQLEKPVLVDVTDENKKRGMQPETSKLVEDEVPTALKVEDAAASKGGDVISSEDVDKTSSEDVEEINHVDDVLLTLY